MELHLRTLALAMLSLSVVPFGAANAETVLGQQVVTAKGYAGDAQETPQAIEVLRPATAGANVLGDLLRGEPGLATQSDGAWGQNPVLRGLKKESVVVMVDGLRVNSAQPQGAIASFMDLGLLDRVEVVKGPGSVLHGSGAMGGVVNMLTPEAAFSAGDRTSGRAGVRFSSVDKGVAGALLVQHSNAEHALVLGVAGRDVDDYRSPDGREDRTGYESNTLLAKYRHRLTEDISLRVNLQRHEDKDVWYPGSARSGAGIPPPLGVATIHSPEQRRELYELGIDAKLGDGQLSAEVYRQEVFRQIRAHAQNLGRDYVRNDVTFTTDGLRAKYVFPVGEGHLLTVGAETWRMRGDPERYMDNNAPFFNNNQRNDPFADGEVEATGLFVQDEFELGRTRIVAGARYDRVSGDAKQKGWGPAAQTSGLDSTDNNLSWSLGAIHPLTETLNAYANVGRAYRAADMRERFEDSARGDGYYHTGNPQLDPEVSTSFEAGLKSSAQGFRYQLAAFYTRIDDYVAGRVTGATHPGSGLPLKRTENLDKVTIYGVEGSASVPVGAYVADAGFTWLRGKNHQDDEPLYQMPAPELRLGIGQPAERGFYWRAQLRAVAEQDRVATRFSNGTEDATSGFVTADAELGWRFGSVGFFDGAAVAVGLHNLADKRYHEHLADGVSGQELAAPGRGITLSLSGSF
ncbi:TonB-dependent receptor plug domain-containing protein [Thauera linaloolentis]|uniref:TonB-dependent receptor n=1 Tax=Thauera linaloolentis (strain DSM 12138 / JCM 21573 / CCUG 41526 / CIP 105981 / IAM 15112 / NBRC 102519 / 47Lol) TaxID=1123367 RepID=N6Z202_THAL4|nr:TonB-dependent receptor [Thauera linaloolentis]ENO88647.1 TonB-dependent receptor [Thauera linaloolentis 47Lol = DSM 12138]MCM8565692.1 TonB-dependent receptor [Thauera linaloolentis]